MFALAIKTPAGLFKNNFYYLAEYLRETRPQELPDYTLYNNYAMAPSLEEAESVQDVISNPLKAKPKLVAPEPEHCPGPESEKAGTADSCAGCPNQQICASAPKGPDPDIPLISQRLEGVRHRVLVLSGKGGVGSTLYAPRRHSTRLLILIKNRVDFYEHACPRIRLKSR